MEREYLTVDELASKTAFDPETIRRWLRGGRPKRLQIWPTLAGKNQRLREVYIGTSHVNLLSAMKLYCTIEIDETVFIKFFENIVSEHGKKFLEHEGRRTQVFSCRQAAKEIGCSTQTVWRWCRNGEIPYTRINRSIKIDRIDLKQFLEQRYVK